MRVTRNGVQRPVEIFFIIFVILAATLLMTRVIQRGVTHDEDPVHNEAYQRQLINEAQGYCTTQCSVALNSDCSQESLARLCLTYASDTISSDAYLDFNRDKQRGLDTTQLAGTGLCEGAVPCHAITSSCCGERINAANCASILRDYWSSQGHSEDAQKELFREHWRTGSCTANTSMWWEQANVSLTANNER